MPSVTAEEITKAKQIDLLSYLQTHEPGELRRTSPHEYRTVSHDSLVISNNRWHWCSRGIGGKTALDYLVHVRQMPFVDAVRLLNDGHTSPSFFQPVENPVSPPKPFQLPEARRFAPNVVAYLQGRGIDPAIIGKCLESGILYESRQYQNCVFVGKSHKGTPMSASLRGTLGDFKGDVSGSDKRFGFALNGSNSHTLLVFESAIDALSSATLDFWSHAPKNHYLALGGTSPLAVVQYLTDHLNIDTVRLRLDNDKAGLDGIAGIERAIRKEVAFSHIKIISEPPPKECGKDYNNLLAVRLAERMKLKTNRNIER